MSVIVFGSAKASPGVTTTAMALAAGWPADRDVLIVEADPDGGVLAARHGLAAEPGLSTFAVTGRRTPQVEQLVRHVQPVSSAGVRALVAPPAAEQARRALDLAAGPLADLLPQMPATDVFVDVGRLRPGCETSPLVGAADAVVLVARPKLDELQQLPARLRALRPVAPRVGVLLVGERPYPPTEVAAALDVEVIAVVAADGRAADALAGHGSDTSLRRSALMRSIRTAVEALQAWLPPPPSTDAHDAPAVADPALVDGSAEVAP